MKILITGGNGYIGSGLTKLLKDSGHEIMLFVRNENSFINEQNFDYRIVDISKKINVQLTDKIDLFIHLASNNNLNPAESETSFSVNTFGTRNCLEFCKENNIKRFLYFSTFQVFGNIEGDFFDNSQKKPNNVYALSHYFAEELVKMYSINKHLRYIIVRPTNTFGIPPFQNAIRWSLVPSCFGIDIKNNNSISLQTSGLQKRDFLFLEDLVGIINQFINKFDEFQDSEINISSGNIYTIREIAELFINRYFIITNKKANLAILSKEPVKSNAFRIIHKNSVSKSYKFCKKEKMTEVIDQIINITQLR